MFWWRPKEEEEWVFYTQNLLQVSLIFRLFEDVDVRKVEKKSHPHTLEHQWSLKQRV